MDNKKIVAALTWYSASALLVSLLQKCLSTHVTSSLHFLWPVLWRGENSLLGSWTRALPVVTGWGWGAWTGGSTPWSEVTTNSGCTIFGRHSVTQGYECTTRRPGGHLSVCPSREVTAQPLCEHCVPLAVSGVPPSSLEQYGPVHTVLSRRSFSKYLNGLWRCELGPWNVYNTLCWTLLITHS